MNKYRITVSSLASDYYKPRKRKLTVDATVQVWADNLDDACEYAKRKFSGLGCTPVEVSQAWVIWPTPVRELKDEVFKMKSTVG